MRARKAAAAAAGALCPRGGNYRVHYSPNVAKCMRRRGRKQCHYLCSSGHWPVRVRIYKRETGCGFRMAGLPATHSAQLNCRCVRLECTLTNAIIDAFVSVVCLSFIFHWYCDLGGESELVK